MSHRLGMERNGEEGGRLERILRREKCYFSEYVVIILFLSKLPPQKKKYEKTFAGVLCLLSSPPSPTTHHRYRTVVEKKICIVLYLRGRGENNDTYANQRLNRTELNRTEKKFPGIKKTHPIYLIIKVTAHPKSLI